MRTHRVYFSGLTKYYRGIGSRRILGVETPAGIVSALSQLFPQFRVSNHRFYAPIANSGSLIRTLDVLPVNYLQIPLRILFRSSYSYTEPCTDWPKISLRACSNQ